MYYNVCNALYLLQYAKIQFYGTNQVQSSTISVTATSVSSGTSECHWEADSGHVFPLQLNQYAFESAEERKSPELHSADFVICIEIWTSFLGGYDYLRKL
jgi:hypothetical protein